MTDPTEKLVNSLIDQYIESWGTKRMWDTNKLHAEITEVVRQVRNVALEDAISVIYFSKVDNDTTESITEAIRELKDSK